MKRKEIIKLIGEAVRSVVPTAEVILFGSEARGEATTDSDIDVLILVDKEKLSYDEKSRIRRPLFMLEMDTGVLILL